MIDDIFELVLTIGGMLLIVGMVAVFPRLLIKITEKIDQL